MATDPPAPHPKPLWEVMGRTPGGAAAESATPEAKPEGGPDRTAESSLGVPPTAPLGHASPSPAPKKLWEVMQPAAGATTSAPAPHAEPARPASEPPTVEIQPAEQTLATLFGIGAEEPLDSARQRSAGRRLGISVRARWALAAGVLSIPLSGLALINAPWSRLPALAAGFAAIVLGLMALAELQRREAADRSRNLALAGILAGILGMFLGPLVVSLAAPRPREHGPAPAALDEEHDDDLMQEK